MNTKIFRFLLTGLFVISTLTATFLPTSVALAAPGCTGTGCNGKDPYVMKCAGSGASYGVVATAKIYNPVTKAELGYVQLWWSYTCKTNWARTVSWVPSSLVDAYVWTASTMYGNTTYGQSVAISPMIYAPTTKAQAYGGVWVNSSNNGTAVTVWK